MAGCATEPTEPATAVPAPAGVRCESQVPVGEEALIRLGAGLARLSWGSQVESWMRDSLRRGAEQGCPEREEIDGGERWLGDGCVTPDGALWFGEVLWREEGALPEEDEPWALTRNLEMDAFAALHPPTTLVRQLERLEVDGWLFRDEARDANRCFTQERALELRLRVDDDNVRVSRGLPCGPIEVAATRRAEGCGGIRYHQGTLLVPDLQLTVSWEHEWRPWACPLQPRRGVTRIEVPPPLETGRSSLQADPVVYRIEYDADEGCDRCARWFRDEVEQGALCGL